MEELIAIFDIGKTNKKILLFDQDYKLVSQEAQKLDQVKDEDGDDCENVSQIMEWVLTTLKQYLANENFNIKAVNVSTYGASFVHIDAEGNPVTPLYNYLKPYPQDILNNFHKTYGDKETLAVETASPPLEMLNSGLQLYFIKYQKPELFKKIKYSLHLPQFCSYLIHGNPVAEMTSIGCHTMLWDFEKEGYHPWVGAEHLDQLFPPVAPTTQTRDVEFAGNNLLAGVGIHDSSSALVPYLMSIDHPFVLISTGTWNISLNPFGKGTLTYDELKKDCLSFINFEGDPVKSSRIFLGNEHNFQEANIASHFNKDSLYHRNVRYDQSIVEKLLRREEQERRFFPETMKVEGLLPGLPNREVNLDAFENFEEAYHQLNIDLVAMQALSTEVAIGQSNIKEIYISGGFCENPLFIQLMADRFPDKKVFTATLSRSTALGAAFVIHKSWNPEGSIKDKMQFERYHALDTGMADYKLY